MFTLYHTDRACKRNPVREVLAPRSRADPLPGFFGLVVGSGSGRCGLVLHCGRKIVGGYLPRSPPSLHPYKNDRGLGWQGGQAAPW
ncbi:MAG: hypothetical protein GDA48_05165 [Hormoscilla sp. GM102CHS1]|nr:hypothetical protein [Hormoscilla sp. GM102CHS1]